jgi:hypothetical protein
MDRLTVNGYLSLNVKQRYSIGHGFDDHGYKPETDFSDIVAFRGLVPNDDSR